MRANLISDRQGLRPLPVFLSHLSEEEPDLCSSSPPSEELRGGKSGDSGFRGEENRAALAVSAAVINKDAPPTDVSDFKARLL